MERGGLNRMFPFLGARDRLAGSSLKFQEESEREEAAMKEVKVRRTAKGVYKGRDPETNLAVYVRPGEVTRVSETKAAQLKQDFPKDWEVPAKGESGRSD